MPEPTETDAPTKYALADWATRHKDVVPFAALFLGALYAVGWLIEARLYGSIEVASLSIPRENAISAATFFAFGPMVTVCCVALAAKSSRPWQDFFIGAIAGPVFTLVAAQMVRGKDGMPQGLMQALLGTYGLLIVGVGVTVALYRLSQARAKNLGKGDFLEGNLQGGLVALSLYVVGSLWGNVVRYLPVEMGGIAVRPVIFAEKKLDGKTIKGVYRAFLVGSDDKGVVLCPRDEDLDFKPVYGNLGDGGLAFVPWDRVGRIESVLPGKYGYWDKAELTAENLGTETPETRKAGKSLGAGGGTGTAKLPSSKASGSADQHESHSKPL